MASHNLSTLLIDLDTFPIRDSRCHSTAITFDGVGLNQQMLKIERYYLHMMRLNALDASLGFLKSVISVGKSRSASEVVELLRTPWRGTVMGAWWSLLHDDPQVTTEILKSLELSNGSLTSPPLAVASVLLAGSDAAAVLREYARRDFESQYGACGFVAAALSHLGFDATMYTASEQDQIDFERMLSLAQHVRTERLH